MNWLPLFLAPRDGTLVDLWVPAQGHRAGFRAHDARFDARQGCWSWDVVHGTPKRIDGATHWMPHPAPPQPVDAVFAEDDLADEQGKRWTSIFADVRERGLVYGVRLTPWFLDLEATGQPQGLAIGDVTFATDHEARALADCIEIFMDELMRRLAVERSHSDTPHKLPVRLSTLKAWCHMAHQALDALVDITNAPPQPGSQTSRLVLDVSHRARHLDDVTGSVMD